MENRLRGLTIFAMLMILSGSDRDGDGLHAPLPDKYSA